MVLHFPISRTDQEQQYFGDGSADDLTTDSLGFRQFRAHDRKLILRPSPTRANRLSKTDRPRDGVRYVLEGSVVRSEEKVRVKAQSWMLRPAPTSGLSAIRPGPGEFIDLQNEITGRIARARQYQLVICGGEPFDRSPDARDYVFKASRAGPGQLKRNYAEEDNV